MLNAALPKQAPKSYILNNAGISLANLTKHITQITNQKNAVTQTINLVKIASDQLKQVFNIEWNNCRLLDVGCGQLLRHAYIFALKNDVIGIDLELPFKYPYVSDFLKTTRNSGFRRANKTLIRQLLGVDYKFRRTLCQQLGVDELPAVPTYLMNAKNLSFKYNFFDGIYSFSTFQHIDEPDKAVKEIYRTLKPNCAAYIQLHLYTSITGSDHPLLQTRPQKYPPWGHLRPSCPYYQKHGLYLNRLRLAQYKKIFEGIFDEVRYVISQKEQNLARPYLSASLRAELKDYSEEELLTSTLTILCKKN